MLAKLRLLTEGLEPKEPYMNRSRSKNLQKRSANRQNLWIQKPLPLSTSAVTLSSCRMRAVAVAAAVVAAAATSLFPCSAGAGGLAELSPELVCPSGGQEGVGLG